MTHKNYIWAIVIILVLAVCIILFSPEPVAAPLPVEEDEQVFCTMDAMLCPDGSYVGRVAPNCKFAECPSGPPAFEEVEFQTEVELVQ